MRNHTPALREARQHLLQHGYCPPGAIDERLARSWQRSAAAGLMPAGRLLEPERHCGGDLRGILARNHALLAHSRPVMEHLFDLVRDSESVVVLSDQRGTLIHTVGTPAFERKAERVALSCGASWLEEHRGTNAIGTALAEGREVEIHGGEHYLERNGFLTCAAAPIRSATGDLLGVLDISGDQHRGHAHTLGLASMAARMIENRLIADGARRHLKMQLHTAPEGIGTLAEGLLVLTEDGWITGGNATALRLLRMGPQAFGRAQVESVLDLRLHELLAQQHRHPHEPMPLRLHDGRTVFVLLSGGALARTPLRVPVRTLEAAGASASVPAVPSDALAALDSGDARWRTAADKARRILDKPIALLVEGESGVGKEFFARAVHDSSARRQGPFVAINCAAIPEHLIESELFGYAPGAFTGARREGNSGRLRQADGGTLFLDEIGDMPLALQARLLRVLQEREVVPLGGGPAVKVDFALVCATHRKLREAVAAGQFRADLYWRINGLAVRLPALRERDDFAALTQRLLQAHAPGRDLRLDPQVLGALAGYSWPGNLRQYASVLRTACALLDDGEDCIGWAHLPEDLQADIALATAAGAAAPVAGWNPPPGPGAGPGAHSLRELSRAAIRQALQDCRGNVSEAARRLGISRQTLYRKMD